MAQKRNSTAKLRKRIFLVDDQEVVLEGITSVIREAKPFKVVGTHNEISEDLPDMIERARAEVVVIDVKFGSGMDPKKEAFGIVGIRRIRRRFGPALGIIAYAGYTEDEFEQLCLRAGADQYISKDYGLKPLLESLGKQKYKQHSYIKSLQLDCGSQLSVTVEISNQDGEIKSGKMTLNANEFALLYYLAQERSRGESDWLAKELSSQKTPPYRFKNLSLWKQVCSSLQARSAERWENDNISHCVFDIKARIHGAASSSHMELIMVPGGGRHSLLQSDVILPSMYCLNEFIEPSSITYTGRNILEEAQAASTPESFQESSST